jgi:hypothetical protein
MRQIGFVYNQPMAAGYEFAGDQGPRLNASSSRCRAMSVKRETMSMPMNFRQFLIAARPTLPVPQKGSTTTSPGFDVAKTQGSANPIGITAL